MRYISAMAGPTTGQLLRRARDRAGLTQAELAARAGTTQSVISAYESDSRQPGLTTLARLVEAAGYDLELRVVERRRLRTLSGPVGRRVRRSRKRLLRIAAAHGLTGLRVFGSVARGEDRPDSDLDLLADLPAGMSLFQIGRATEALETAFGSPIDLVPADSLKPDVARRISSDLVAL